MARFTTLICSNACSTLAGRIPGHVCQGYARGLHGDASSLFILAGVQVPHLASKLAGNDAIGSDEVV
jgi:hypothetical protein